MIRLWLASGKRRRFFPLINHIVRIDLPIGLAIFYGLIDSIGRVGGSARVVLEPPLAALIFRTASFIYAAGILDFPRRMRGAFIIHASSRFWHIRRYVHRRRGRNVKSRRRSISKIADRPDLRRRRQRRLWRMTRA